MPIEAPPRPIEPGQRLARWFGPPYNAWFVGKVDHINKRRTKSENVCVAFNDATFGETRGMFVADADTYGTDRLWCLLRAIPIELDADDEAEAGQSATGGTAAPATHAAGSSTSAGISAGAGSSGSK
eukprot:7388556-Prymnesium_polylepis.1